MVDGGARLVPRGFSAAATSSLLVERVYMNKRPSRYPRWTCNSCHFDSASKALAWVHEAETDHLTTCWDGPASQMPRSLWTAGKGSSDKRIDRALLEITDPVRRELNEGRGVDLAVVEDLLAVISGAEVHCDCGKSYVGAECFTGDGKGSPQTPRLGIAESRSGRATDVDDDKGAAYRKGP